MKKYIALMVSTVLLTGLLPIASAQGPDVPPEDPQFGPHKKFPGKPDARRGGFKDRHKPGAGKKHVEAWLERLKENNPEEYERLNQLREERPEAFRRELRFRLKQERVRQNLKDFPEVAEAFKNMSPEDRQRFFKRFGERHGQEPPGEGPQVFRELHRQIRKLAEAYSLADHEDLREDLRAQLEARLGQMHEAQLQVRQQHLQRIEKEIEKLRTSIEEEQQKRDAFIEEHMNRILRAATPDQPLI